MLVNLSYDPKSLVRERKACRESLQENSGEHDAEASEFRKIIKQHRKIYTFKSFFRKYQPRDWEYAKNDPETNLTGVYVVRYTDLSADFVNRLTKQTARDPYDKENYRTGDIWRSYGLCDNASQAVKYYYDRKAEGRFKGNHIIIMEPMGKGGWRWHKWGTYIGKFEARHEYFYEEEGIENVWFFEIIKVV